MVFSLIFLSYHNAGERVWPNPPIMLGTIADGMRLQQVGHLPWPILKDMAEKSTIALVRVLMRI